LLDILERHGAQATFFFIGRNVAKYPDLVREVVRRGHTVGNHTMNHDQYWFWAYGPRGAQREVADCQAALTEAGVEARYFRAPAGLKSPFLQSAVERAGLPLVCWSARGLDGISTDRARIMARLKESVRPGGIVLVHEGRADENGDRLAPDVLAALLEWLDETGIRCVLPDPAV
jgi:peptidoglycan/xylan/chitin deacetylase (PgdA/CDA1 family)